MNHKARQLILHFGFPKTGTTALQRTLFNHRDHLLKSHNTLYPGSSENHFYLRALFAERPESLFQIQMLGLNDHRAISDFLESYRQEILTEINTTKPDRIIISCEAFITMPLDELKKLQVFLKTLAEEIVLFAYVRDPWGEAVSLLQEQILTGYGKKEAKFMYAHPPPLIIKKVEAAFRVRAIIAPYVNQAGDLNVVVDFCHRFELHSLMQIAQEYTNVRSGMKWEATCVLLQLNQLYPVFNEDNSFVSDPARDLMRDIIRNSPLSRTPLRISTRAAKRIYENSRSDVEFLEKYYFNGTKYFTERYNTLQTTEFDDTLTISAFDPEQLSEFLLSCMHLLAQRSIDRDSVTRERDRLVLELEEIKKSRAWKFASLIRKIREFFSPRKSHNKSA